MQSRHRTSALAIVLLSLVWPLAGHLTAQPDRELALVLAVGGIAASARAARRSGLAPALALAGLALLLGGASTSFLERLAWRLHEIPASAPEFLSRRWLAMVLPVPALCQGKLAVWAGESTETLQLTHESLGLHVVWYLILTIGVTCVPPLWQRGWRAVVPMLAGSAAGIFGYAILRFAVLSALAVEFGRPDLFWQHGYTVASWLPLALILRWPMPLHRSPLPRGTPGWAGSTAPRASRASEGRSPGSHVGRGVRLGQLGRAARDSAPALASFCLAFAATYNDPGLVKQGRVVIDESHSDWEWTQERFDTTAFGIRAEYNYYCLREYLSHFYEVATLQTLPLGAALDSADVLVIKTPTRPYGDREIDAIVGFVERGGGLLLIGDHTNLFGMSAYLNSIARRFGMRLRFDDTFDLETTAFSTYRRPRVWFHPAVRAVQGFEFLTSCTIDGSLATEPVMIGSGLGSEDVDYGHPNFFGDIAFDLCDRFGVFLQAAARRSGKGRVLLFTDSTCFSNFCMFSPGKPELAVGFVDYLNRCGEKYPRARFCALALAGILIGLWLKMGRWTKARRHAVGLVFGPCAAFVLGIAATSCLNAHIYRLPGERAPLASVVFDTSHCDVSFFDHMGVSRLDTGEHFEELYLCAQRLGLHPRAASLKSLRGHSPTGIVIANPVHGFTESEISQITRYVSSGGVLVLLGRGGDSRSTANQILRPFGLEAYAVPVRSRQVNANDAGGGGAPGHPGDGAGASQGADFYPGLMLLGARVHGLGSPPIPNVFIRDFGKGRVVVCLNSYRYCEAVVGRPLQRTPPSPGVAALYREVFAILSVMEPAFTQGRQAFGVVD